MKEGIHPNYVETNPTQESTGDERYMLFLGRLSPEKGIRTLLRAYEALSEALPLVIAGEGPEHHSLEECARLKGLPAHFLGFQQGEPLRAVLSGARAVIIPSEWYENAPLAVLEAFAAGKPVIGARIGGIPEMIHDGTDGLLFSPGDSLSLGKSLRRFLSLPSEEVAAMGRRALKKVETFYNSHIHCKRLLRLYLDPAAIID